MIHLKELALAGAVTLGAFAGPASAENTSIIFAMQLEPPHLDPTSAAAQAIDSVVYANIFEGLTRFEKDGSISPALER